MTYGWAIKWRSANKLDGKRHFLLGCGTHALPDHLAGYRTMVFATRQEARDYVSKTYDYIRKRIDLQKEPHGWKMPLVVKVSVSVQEIAP